MSRRLTRVVGRAKSTAAVFGLLALLIASAVPAEAATKSSGYRPRTSASAFVPGTGTEIPYAGDNFEGANWGFEHRHPKSSREQDERTRGPMGESTNGRWHEGPERGQPDQIEVVPTPPGGLEGSEHALLLRTLRSGIPGSITNTVQQDDLISSMLNRIGSIPVGERPSVVIRVYLPPAEQWEQRGGPQFGFRTSASTMTVKKSASFFFSQTDNEVEPYWPGMWIHFHPATKGGMGRDKKPIEPQPAYAVLAIRGDRLGRDYRAKEIRQFGWWTLGMSYSADGMVHYYASPGVDDLTSADYLASEFPYSYQARQFRTYFVDVCNLDNGRNWSTPFVIDDPKLYVQSPQRIQSIVARRERSAQQMAERRAKQAEMQARREEQQKQRMAERQTQREAARQRTSSSRPQSR